MAKKTKPEQLDIEKPTTTLGRPRKYSKNLAVAVTDEQYAFITTRETEFGPADASSVIRSLIDRART